MTKYLDEAIEALTKLRISAIKEGRHDTEQKLYEVEMLIFKAYDNDKSSDMHEFNIPAILDFKKLRNGLKMSLREVAIATNVSAPTISRIERGHNADFKSVKSLFMFYNSKKS